MLLRLDPNSPSQMSGPMGGLTILSGAAVIPGYTVLAAMDWGQVDWQHQFTGPRGTQGARPSQGTPQNRSGSVPIRVFGTSKDSLLQQEQKLFEALDDMRRFGGKVLWQSNNQTYRQFFDVLTCTWQLGAWGNEAETIFKHDILCSFVCAPYALGDPMDTTDGFDTNTYATDYTKDAGSATLSVSGGRLVPSDTTLKRIRHTLKGYQPADVQVTVKATTGASVTTTTIGVTARADPAGADTLLAAEIVGAATNLLRVSKYVAGVQTTLASTAFTPAINTTYWVRLRCEGNLVTAEVFTSTPNPTVAPAFSVAAGLLTNAGETNRFMQGHCGLRITPAATTEAYDDFTIEPYTYRLINTPEQIRLGGLIPGDLPALADLVLSPNAGTATPIWGMAAWSERPTPTNWCWNGDLEDSTIGTGGWVATAVAGVIGAATSVARDTTAARNKYGGANLSIVCPATIDTGGSFQIFQRFKRGRTYAAFCWASSAAGVTIARIKLGVNGDLAVEGAVALSATPTLHSVAWQPGVDANSAYVAFGINAATATTMSIDGVNVIESPSISLNASITNVQTTLTVYNTPAEMPGLKADGTLAAPFLALIISPGNPGEIIRANAISGNTWTIDRGQEASTAVAHTIEDLVVLLPFRPQYEGKGANAAFAVLEAEAYVPTLSSATSGSLTNTVDTDARTGFRLAWNPAASGTATLIWMIDPHTLLPDDYTLGEVDVEVMLRVKLSSSANTPKVTLSVLPEGGATTGVERFTREWGSTGLLLPPNGAAAVYRLERLGTLPLIVDRANPQRWRLKAVLSLAAAGNLDTDYLILNPIRFRVSDPTAKVNDTASGGAFPAFVPYNAAWGASSTMTTRLRADGSATIAVPGAPEFPHHGKGRPVELPDADCDLIIKVSNLVPNDPTSDTTNEMFAAAPSWALTAHAAVTPRYGLGRGS